MCGIAGVVRWDGRPSQADHRALAEMADVLAHRGPDAEGVIWSGPCGLAHRRLSIIDLSEAGTQPMSNEDGCVWTVYNGETYNFRELRTRFGLDGRGHRFRSRTDTEVLLHLFEELGTDSFTHLNGMFAVAVWDATSATLHLARDGFGIKPLFYCTTPEGFWFASEIKALLLVPGLRVEPSVEALHHFLGFNYVPGHLTAFEGIRELRPGHRLEVSTRRREPAPIRFYEVGYDPDPKMSEADAIQESRDHLKQAVSRHLIADVPVGVMLSGGMDSSSLAALMAEVRGDNGFHTFSLAFHEPTFDESPSARTVASALGTRHHEIVVTPKAILDLLPRYLAYIDEPYADGSAMPTYLLAGTAKNFVTVLLSGEGGDEIFSGYDTHAAHKARAVYRHVPAPIRRIFKRCVDALPVSHAKLSFEFKAKRFVRGAEYDVPRSHYYWRMVLSEDAKRSVLRQTSDLPALAPSDGLFVDAYRRCRAVDELNKLLYIDWSYHLPDDLMIKNDRMTMAHSLEARVPFTDKELVAFLGTVPVQHKVKGLKTKHLLRTAMAGSLPASIVSKKKVGLEIPYSKWMRNELRDFIADTLSRSRVAATGLLDPHGVERLWKEHCRLQHDHGRALWGILNYVLWHQLYIERKTWRSWLTPARTARAEYAATGA